jgi:mycofactocin precursor
MESRKEEAVNARKSVTLPKPDTSTRPEASTEKPDAQILSHVELDELIREITIDGMCGVY